MTPPSQPNFDRIATIYRWGEYLSLGPLLQRTRTRLLDQLRNPRHALVLGDGDGRFLEQLLLRYPQCNFAVAADISAAMLDKLQRRCLYSVPHAASRLTTLQRSALEIDPPPFTDLIVTHFLFDCFSQPDVDALAARIASQLAPGTLWLVSDFALPDSQLLRPFARLAIASLPRRLPGCSPVWRINQLPDPQSALHRNGMRRIARSTLLGGLLSVTQSSGGASRLVSTRNPHRCANIHHRMSSSTPPSRTPFNAAERDPVSDPEPPVPALPEPDPGVFHHEPNQAPAKPEKDCA